VLGFRCDGEDMIGCDGTIATRTEAPPNQTCRPLGPDSAAFRAAGEPCDRSGCLGGHAIECDLAVHLVVNDVDCTSIGRVCREFGPSVVCEPPPTSDCADTAPSCIGDLVRFCSSDQRLHDYDCRAHGFAGCEERLSPSFGTLAGCTPLGARF
jgi:hypothetical protein